MKDEIKPHRFFKPGVKILALSSSSVTISALLQTKRLKAVAFRQMDRQWKQAHCSVFYESMPQDERGLCSALVAAELKHSERNNKNVGQVMS